MSTSPESSAATRVASLRDDVELDPLEVVLRLVPPVRVRGQHGAAVGLAAPSMKGPVPVALRVAKFSLALGEVGRLGVALFSSAQALDMMPSW